MMLNLIRYTQLRDEVESHKQELPDVRVREGLVCKQTIPSVEVMGCGRSKEGHYSSFSRSTFIRSLWVRQDIRFGQTLLLLANYEQ